MRLGNKTLIAISVTIMIAAGLACRDRSTQKALMSNDSPTPAPQAETPPECATSKTAVDFLSGCMKSCINAAKKQNVCAGECFTALSKKCGAASHWMQSNSQSAQPGERCGITVICGDKTVVEPTMVIGHSDSDSACRIEVGIKQSQESKGYCDMLDISDHVSMNPGCDSCHTKDNGYEPVPVGTTSFGDPGEKPLTDRDSVCARLRKMHDEECAKDDKSSVCEQLRVVVPGLCSKAVK